MKLVKQCPFCGHERVVLEREDEYQNYYHCPNCEYDFSDEDVEHELLRQKVSSICSAFEATEEHPIDCTRPEYSELHIEGFNEPAQGLSEAEKPQVLTIFQDPEGIVWFTSDFTEEPVELDSILTDSIREILMYLEENLNVGIDENGVTYMHKIAFSEYQ